MNKFGWRSLKRGAILPQSSPPGQSRKNAVAAAEQSARKKASFVVSAAVDARDKGSRPARDAIGCYGAR